MLTHISHVDWKYFIQSSHRGMSVEMQQWFSGLVISGVLPVTE